MEKQLAKAAGTMTRAEMEERVREAMARMKRKDETVESAIARFGGMAKVARMLSLSWQD